MMELSRDAFGGALLLLCCPLLLTACPEDETDDDDSLPPGEGCSVDGDCLNRDGLEICEDGRCVEGDRNSSREDAQLIEYGESIDGHIAPAGDVDWYRFNGTQGEMVRMLAAAEDTSQLDTVLRYFDAEGNEIGFNDDWTRVSSVPPDARLHTGVPATGTLYFTVEDRGTWAGEPESNGGSRADYSVTIADFGRTTTSTQVPETGNAPSTATDWVLEEVRQNYTCGGFLEAPGDVDWLAVPVTAGEVLRLYGVPNNGTAADALITAHYVDHDGELVPIKGYRNLSLDNTNRGWVPVLETGTYFLSVEDAGGGGGDDFWYVWHGAKNDASDGFPGETEPNDSLGEGEDPLSGAPGIATSWGRIHPAGDEDRWLIDAQVGDRLTLVFEDLEEPSPASPRFRLLDPDGAVELEPDWTLGSPPPTATLHELTRAGSYTIVVYDDDPAAGSGDRLYQLRVAIQRPR